LNTELSKVIFSIVTKSVASGVFKSLAYFVVSKLQKHFEKAVPIQNKVVHFII